MTPYIRTQKSLADLKSNQKSAEQEGKDKKRAEKMAAIMAELKTVSTLAVLFHLSSILTSFLIMHRAVFPRRKPRLELP
jgi:hypothetical protein